MTQPGQRLAGTNTALRLHLRRCARGRYRWLTAPGAAALSILFLEGVDSVTPVPRLVWLVGRGDEILDQAMVCDLAGGVLVTCHGGPAVRRRIEEVLLEQGFGQTAFEPFGSTQFERQTLGLLPAAQGVAAVALILEAARQGPALAVLQPQDVAQVLDACAAADLLTDAPRVQLWGPVNAGKSSLLNALCGRHLAAVGDEPGLTRDVIEGRCEHDGFVLRVFDAPGTWAGGGALDAAAQVLAARWRDEADLVVTLAASPRAAEFAGNRMPYDVGDPNSLTRLQSALVGHFFGRLRCAPAHQRFALHPELRADLSTMSLAAFREAWLAK